jgi:hypothetical protein
VRFPTAIRASAGSVACRPQSPTVQVQTRTARNRGPVRPMMHQSRASLSPLSFLALFIASASRNPQKPDAESYPLRTPLGVVRNVVRASQILRIKPKPAAAESSLLAKNAETSYQSSILILVLFVQIRLATTWITGLYRLGPLSNRHRFAPHSEAGGLTSVVQSCNRRRVVRRVFSDTTRNPSAQRRLPS